MSTISIFFPFSPYFLQSVKHSLPTWLVSGVGTFPQEPATLRGSLNFILYKTKMNTLDFSVAT